MNDKHAGIRAALAAKPEPIYTDLYGDRYFNDSYSRVDSLTKAQDDFVTSCNPVAITALLADRDALAELLEEVNRAIWDDGIRTFGNLPSRIDAALQGNEGDGRG